MTGRCLQGDMNQNVQEDTNGATNIHQELYCYHALKLTLLRKETPLCIRKTKKGQHLVPTYVSIKIGSLLRWGKLLDVLSLRRATIKSYLGCFLPPSYREKLKTNRSLNVIAKRTKKLESPRNRLFFFLLPLKGWILGSFSILFPGVRPMEPSCCPQFLTKRVPDSCHPLAV